MVGGGQIENYFLVKNKGRRERVRAKFLFLPEF